MAWVPESGMWLSFLRVDAAAGDLDFDLAIDASGAGDPSPVDAGFQSASTPAADGGPRWGTAVWLALAVVGAFAMIGGLERRRFGRPAV